MRNTVHQVLVQAVSDGIPCAACLGCLGIGIGVEHRHLAVGNLLDQFLRIVDAIVHTGKQHRLAVKAGGLHVFVRRNDDAVTGGDFLSSQHIFGTVRAVGFHFGGKSQLFACLGQCLGCHIGVGNAVGASRHRQNAVTGLGDFLLGKAFLAELRILAVVDGLQEFGRGLGITQGLHKFLVHQHLHQTRQHIHMQAAVLGCGNRKQQVGFAVVLGVVLHRLRQAQRRQAGAGHAGRAGMGYRDAVVHIGRCLVLARQQRLFVGGGVSDVAMGRLQCHQLVQDFIAGRERRIQRNGMSRKQFRDTHSYSPSYRCVISFSAVIRYPLFGQVPS